MNVVWLDQFTNRDTLDVLRALLQKAEAGDIVGLAVCFKDRKGAEDCALTGHFARNPDKAAAATLRLSMRVANARGEYDTAV